MTRQVPLTGLRGFLALTIIWWHFHSPSIFTCLFDIDLYFLILFPGRIAVWLFFIISGYSIYHGFRNSKYDLNLKDSIRFYHNRAIRILPLFYLSALVSWIFFLYFFPSVLPPWPSIVRSLFFLNFNFYDGINAFTPLWFVGIIVHFYIVAPLLVKGYRYIYKKVGIAPTFILLVIASPLCQYLGHLMVGGYDIRNLVGCLPFFLFGFLAYDVHKDARPLIQRAFKLLPQELIYLTLVILLEFASFMYQYRDSSFFATKTGLFIKYFGLCWLDGYIGFTGMALIIVLLNKKETINQKKTEALLFCRKFVRTFFEKMGAQGYSLYLFHNIVITAITAKMQSAGFFIPPSSWATLLFFTLVVGLTYGLAIVLDQFFGNVYLKLYRQKND